MTRINILAAAIASSLASAPAWAALTLTYENAAESPGGAPGVDTITLDGQRLRAEQSRSMSPRGPGGPMVVIFDGATKKVVFVSQDKKSYSELTEADVKTLRERMEGMRAQMGDRIKSLPPEQRERVERMMSGQGPDLKFTAKKQKKTINGFACEMYEVTMDGKPFQESCIAPWGTGPFTKTDADAAKAVFAALASMMKGMPGAGVQHMASYPGVPIQTKHLASPAGSSTQTLKSISRAPVAAAQFQVPAGYTKEPLPMMGGGGGAGMGRGMGPGGPHGGPPGQTKH